MHTVDLLEQALLAAQRLGFRVRLEWLGGQTGGACEIMGQKWLFLDLGLGPVDQLQVVAEALRQEPGAAALSLSPPLSDLLALRKTA